MSKFGSETNDNISPLFESISKAAPPEALNVLSALFNSLLIMY